MSNLHIDAARVARVFKALSNPHRLTIFLNVVSRLGDSSLDTSDEGIQQCQLDQARTLGLAPSTVSSHYKELRDSGLIRMERQGKSVRFWIDPQTLELARSVLGPCASRAEHPDND